MFCPSCGHENVEEARFCSSCGSPLVAAPESSEARPFRAPGLESGTLPPRDLGGLISETFAVYGRSFWPFVSIAVVPEIVFIVAGLAPIFAATILFLVGILLSILAAGAGIYAVAQHYVGPGIDVGRCFSEAWQRAFNLVVAAIVVFLAIVGSVILMVIIVGIPLFFYLFVIWFFVFHVIMLENRYSLAALGRSRQLVRGSWWRVFGIGIIFVLLMLVLTIVLSIPATILASTNAAAGNVATAVIGTLMSPIAYIGGTLVYFDLRVRKEGYTLELLASEMGR